MLGEFIRAYMTVNSNCGPLVEVARSSLLRYKSNLTTLAPKQCNKLEFGFSGRPMILR